MYTSAPKPCIARAPELVEFVRRLRSVRLKRFEVYANSAKLSTLMSAKFVVAKLSSQTLRGLRKICEALNSNAKFHFYLVTRNVRDALKRSYSFRTLRRLHEFCEAFNSTTVGPSLTLSSERNHVTTSNMSSLHAQGMWRGRRPCIQSAIFLSDHFENSESICSTHSRISSSERNTTLKWPKYS